MDIWFTAYENILERYLSARQAIKILRNKLNKIENQDLQIRILESKIHELRKQLKERNQKIAELSKLDCGKVGFKYRSEADQFAKFVTGRIKEKMEVYRCSYCGMLHIRHEDRRLRGMYRKA